MVDRLVNQGQRLIMLTVEVQIAYCRDTKPTGQKEIINGLVLILCMSRMPIPALLVDMHILLVIASITPLPVSSLSRCIHIRPTSRKHTSPKHNDAPLHWQRQLWRSIRIFLTRSLHPYKLFRSLYIDSFSYFPKTDGHYSLLFVRRGLHSGLKIGRKEGFPC